MTVKLNQALVVGVDPGTWSGRAVVVAVAEGTELGSAVFEYPHAVVDGVLPGSGRPLHDHFSRRGSKVMHRLKSIQRAAHTKANS